MLAQQRQVAILDRVRAAGGVRVSELVAEYGVSDMTIRRDLESLADRGLLAKVHGGATTVRPGSAYERAGYTTPNLMEADIDRALVEAAERLVVLADHTKWGTVGISSIVPLSRADALITDDGLDETAQAVLAEQVKELIVVSAP
jgi:DeoR/GlpR family transcriptional regulator of sugar metabolism